MKKILIIAGICVALILIVLLLRKIVFINGGIGIATGGKTKYKDEDLFTYNVQFAHFKNSQIEEKGEIAFDEVNAVFDGFPWIEELNKPDIRTSPTITFSDHKEKRDLAVSIVGAEGKRKYFHLFLVKDKKIKVLEGMNEEFTKNVIKIFFGRDSNSLDDMFKQA
jgi:hypothetical protein